MNSTIGLKKLSIFLIILILLSASIIARQFHPVSEVDPGIFQTGLYVFPTGGILNISSSLILPTSSISGAGHNSGLDADTLDSYHKSYFQTNVSGTCGAGSSIRVVYPNGSVDCETDNDVDGCSNCLDGTEVNEAGLTCSLITGGAGLCDGTDAYNSAYDTEAEIDTAVSNNGYLTSESDPQVSTLTSSKWCTANVGATAIDCTQNQPGGISSCTTRTASGNSYADNPITISCSGGEKLTGGGCNQTSSGTGTGWKSNYPNSNTFYCAAAYGSNIATTAYAICCT